MRVATLAGTDQFPAWLARANELLLAAGRGEICGHWTLAPTLHHQSILAAIVSRPIGGIERGAFNPRGVNAFASTQPPGLRRQRIANLADLGSEVRAQRIDVLLCEASCA